MCSKMKHCGFAAKMKHCGSAAKMKHCGFAAKELKVSKGLAAFGRSRVEPWPFYISACKL